MTTEKLQILLYSKLFFAIVCNKNIICNKLHCAEENCCNVGLKFMINTESVGLLIVPGL